MGKLIMDYSPSSYHMRADGSFEVTSNGVLKCTVDGFNCILYN